MEIYDNKICFEIDERTKDTLKLAFRVLDLDDEDGDMLFRQFVQYTIQKALHRSRRMETSFFDEDQSMRFITSDNNSVRRDRNMGYLVTKSPLEKLDSETTKSRIMRWARNKRGFAYKILSVYFKCYDESENHIVERRDMFILNIVLLDN